MSSSKKFYVHFVTSIKLLAAACISLSVKSNGENIELDAIIITFFCVLQHTRRSTLDEEFKKIKDSLIKMECIILRMIDFDLNHRLAHELLIYFLFDIHQELESVNMWYVIFELCSKISSDFYLSNKCLNYKPEELASSSIQAAFYIAGMDIDTSPYMKTWLQNTTTEIAPAAKSKSFSIDKEKTTDPLIRKRVPENAEGVAVLVGQLPELEKPASTFVRLAEGKLIQHFLEGKT